MSEDNSSSPAGGYSRLDLFVYQQAEILKSVGELKELVRDQNREHVVLATRVTRLEERLIPSGIALVVLNIILMALAQTVMK
jgi:hypothetical protein